MGFNATGIGAGALGGATTGFSLGGPWGAGIGALAGGFLGSGILGGSPGSGGYSGSPAQAQPIDFNQLMQQANANAAQQVGAQFSDQTNYYPTIQNLQLGTIGALAGKLNNSYTALATSGVNQALGETGNIDAMASNAAAVAPSIGQQGGKLSALGDGLQYFGMGQLANAGPNSLESSLYGQTATNLALGSDLSAEDLRAATQQANQAWASRGLGTGTSAGAAEILGRYQLGQQRLAQRQGAAISADNSINANVIARQGVGLSALGQAGNTFGNAASAYGQQVGAYGTAGNLYNLSGNLALNAANTAVAIDPYQRAMGIGANLAGQNLGNSAGIIGQTYAGANQLAGNVASFNANMLDSRYNAYQNNQAALQGAQTGANGQLLGAGIGALGSIGGAYMQSQGYGGYGLLGTLNNNLTNAGHYDGTT